MHRRPLPALGGDLVAGQDRRRLIVAAEIRRGDVVHPADGLLGAAERPILPGLAGGAVEHALPAQGHLQGGDVGDLPGRIVRIVAIRDDALIGVAGDGHAQLGQAAGRGEDLGRSRPVAEQDHDVGKAEGLGLGHRNLLERKDPARWRAGHAGGRHGATGALQRRDAFELDHAVGDALLCRVVEHAGLPPLQRQQEALRAARARPRPAPRRRRLPAARPRPGRSPW